MHLYYQIIILLFLLSIPSSSLFFLVSQWFQEQGRYFYGQHKFPDEETGNSSLNT